MTCPTVEVDVDVNIVPSCEVLYAYDPTVECFEPSEWYVHFKNRVTPSIWKFACAGCRNNIELRGQLISAVKL